MDIRAGIIAATVLSLIGALFGLRAGLRAIQSARKLTFFKLRRGRTIAGWRLIGLAVFLLGLAAALGVWGEPVAYHYFPPSPSPTLTLTPSLVPTVTLTPSITLTPSVTDTPAVTDTATITPTPYLPPAIEAQFTSLVTPNPNANFSPLQFSTVINIDVSNGIIEAVSPGTFFRNPITHMYGVFTYTDMLPGVQWTAIWYRDGIYVFHETKPWDGGTGGYGYTDWGPPADQWLPGTYQVALFVGQELKKVGIFVVEGEAPTVTPSLTPPPTLNPTPTAVPSATPTPPSTP